MNLIAHKVDLKRVLSEEKKQKWAKFRNISILVMFIIFSFGGYFVFSAKGNEADAALFEISDDYQSIIDINNQIVNAVPIPIESISMDEAGGDKRVMAVLIFLKKYKSPMANTNVARAFVENADKNGFGDNWPILIAISGIESGFGRVTPYKPDRKSYNAWGWTSGGSSYSRWAYFNSWEDAIEKISKGLAKGYGPQNLTPKKMVARYCPDCVQGADKDNSHRWDYYVQGYIDDIKGIHNSLK